MWLEAPRTLCWLACQTLGSVDNFLYHDFLFEKERKKKIVKYLRCNMYWFVVVYIKRQRVNNC